ncbi:hypothetical protein HK102_004758, partial [Quaeritorhiza haematococci]
MPAKAKKKSPSSGGTKRRKSSSAKTRAKENGNASSHAPAKPEPKPRVPGPPIGIVLASIRAQQKESSVTLRVKQRDWEFHDFLITLPKRATIYRLMCEIAHWQHNDAVEPLDIVIYHTPTADQTGSSGKDADETRPTKPPDDAEASPLESEGKICTDVYATLIDCFPELAKIGESEPIPTAPEEGKAVSNPKAPIYAWLEKPPQPASPPSTNVTFMHDISGMKSLGQTQSLGSRVRNMSTVGPGTFRQFSVVMDRSTKLSSLSEAPSQTILPRQSVVELASGPRPSSGLAQQHSKSVIEPIGSGAGGGSWTRPGSGNDKTVGFRNSNVSTASPAAAALTILYDVRSYMLSSTNVGDRPASGQPRSSGSGSVTASRAGSAKQSHIRTGSQTVQGIATEGQGQDVTTKLPRNSSVLNSTNNNNQSPPTNREPPSSTSNPTSAAHTNLTTVTTTSTMPTLKAINSPPRFDRSCPILMTIASAPKRRSFTSSFNGDNNTSNNILSRRRSSTWSPKARQSTVTSATANNGNV